MSGPVELSGDAEPDEEPAASEHEGLQDSGGAGKSPAEETEPTPADPA